MELGIEGIEEADLICSVTQCTRSAGVHYVIFGVHQHAIGVHLLCKLGDPPLLIRRAIVLVEVLPAGSFADSHRTVSRWEPNDSSSIFEF